MNSLLSLANSEFEYEGQASYDRKQNLLQQVRLLTSTRKGSVPLDRDLGLDFSFVDRPIGVVRSLCADHRSNIKVHSVAENRRDQVEWQR